MQIDCCRLRDRNNLKRRHRHRRHRRRRRRRRRVPSCL